MSNIWSIGEPNLGGSSLNQLNDKSISINSGKSAIASASMLIISQRLKFIYVILLLMKRRKRSIKLRLKLIDTNCELSTNVSRSICRIIFNDRSNVRKRFNHRNANDEIRLIPFDDKSRLSNKTLFWKVSGVSSVIKLPLRLAAVKFGNPFSSTAFILHTDKSICRNETDTTYSLSRWTNVRRWFPLKFTNNNCGICAKTVCRSIPNLHALTSNCCKLDACKSGRVYNGFELNINCSNLTKLVTIIGPLILWMLQLLRFSFFKLLLTNSSWPSWPSGPVKAPNGFPDKSSVSRLIAVSKRAFGLKLIQPLMLLFDSDKWCKWSGNTTSFGMDSKRLKDRSNVSSAWYRSRFGGNLRRLLCEMSNLWMILCRWRKKH